MAKTRGMAKAKAKARGAPKARAKASAKAKAKSAAKRARTNAKPTHADDLEGHDIKDGDASALNLATDPKDNKKGKEKDTKDKKTPRPYVRKGRVDPGVDKAEDGGEKKRAKRGSAQTFARGYPPQ